MLEEHNLERNMSFGENIRRLRRDKGWTQVKLAEKAGLKSTHITKIEKETTDPKLSTIYKLIAALECSADSMLMDYEKIGVDGVLRSTIERASNLPEINKKIIIEVIDGYCISKGLEASFNDENKTMFKIITAPNKNAIPAEELKAK